MVLLHLSLGQALNQHLEGWGLFLLLIADRGTGGRRGRLTSADHLAQPVSLTTLGIPIIVEFKLTRYLRSRAEAFACR